MSTKQQPLTLGQIRRQSWFYAFICSLSSLLLLAGGGYVLDLVLDKKPFFTIIGFVLAFIATFVSLVIIGHKKFK